MPTHRQTPNAPVPKASMRGFAAVAALVFAALLGYMFWPTPPASMISPAVVLKPESSAPIKPPVLTTTWAEKSPKLQLSLDAPETPEVTEPEFEKLTLTKRLGQYFLNDIALDNVQLGQAMATLRQMLQETDKENKLGLNQLIVSTPASAMGRRVTLHSSGMAYLKAVEILAAMAGCEVEVDETHITLKTLPGAYPQIATQMSPKALLDGLFTADGKPMRDDERRLSMLWDDARLLGISLDTDGNGKLTPAQYEALRQLTQYRNELDQYPIPAFAAYVLPEGSLTSIYQTSPAQVFQLLMALHQQGFVPYAYIPYFLLDPAVSQQVLVVIRRGDSVFLALSNTTPQAELAEEPLPTETPQPQQTGSVEQQAVMRTGAALGITSYIGSSYWSNQSNQTGLVLDQIIDEGVSASVVSTMLSKENVKVTQTVVQPPAGTQQGGAVETAVGSTSASTVIDVAPPATP